MVRRIGRSIFLISVFATCHTICPCCLFFFFTHASKLYTHPFILRRIFLPVWLPPLSLLGEPATFSATFHHLHRMSVVSGQHTIVCPILKLFQNSIDCLRRLCLLFNVFSIPDNEKYRIRELFDLRCRISCTWRLRKKSFLP